MFLLSFFQIVPEERLRTATTNMARHVIIVPLINRSSLQRNGRKKGGVPWSAGHWTGHIDAIFVLSVTVIGVGVYVNKL